MIFFDILRDSVTVIDIVIILLGAVNAAVFILAYRAARKLHTAMTPKVCAPSYEEDETRLRENSLALTDESVLDMREKAIRRYSWYVNITGIFPLMGIMGTVISLIKITGENGMEESFMAALTSTFWGLVFAIIFRALDSLISPNLEVGEDIADLQMQRNTAKAAEKAEKERL